ncbi:MAG: haloacid dehalogenase type II [bacterium]
MVFVDRRMFVQQVGIGLAGAALSPSLFSATTNGLRRSTVKAIAFDAFPIFDPRPIATTAEALFPGRGAELMNVWRTRQFEYTWLRSLARDYVDFWRVTEDALHFAATSLGLDLSSARREELMNAYLHLRAWPDVADASKALSRNGTRLVLLSNFSPAMLKGCIASSGLDGVFEHAISTDVAQTYKPDPRAYQLGVDALGLSREEIVFAAFAGWDAAGAKRFGYPTFWVNRTRAIPEVLGVEPDGAGQGLSDLVAFVESRRS